jgi:hypothetical protein
MSVSPFEPAKKVAAPAFEATELNFQSIFEKPRSLTDQKAAMGRCRGAFFFVAHFRFPGAKRPPPWRWAHR